MQATLTPAPPVVDGTVTIEMSQFDAELLRRFVSIGDYQAIEAFAETASARPFSNFTIRASEVLDISNRLRDALNDALDGE